MGGPQTMQSLVQMRGPGRTVPNTIVLSSGLRVLRTETLPSVNCSFIDLRGQVDPAKHRYQEIYWKVKTVKRNIHDITQRAASGDKIPPNLSSS